MAIVTYGINGTGSGLLDFSAASGVPSTAHSVATLTGGSVLTAFVSGDAPFYVEARLNSKIFNLATTPLKEISPQVAGLANGGAVAVFDEIGQGVSLTKAHIFDANGNPVASDFFVTNTDFTPEINPDVAALNDGGFVVGWERLTSASDHDVYARVFNADGSSRADVIIAAASNNETNPALASLATGGFAAAWVKHVGANTELWTAHYDSNGNTQGSATLVDHFGSVNDQPQIVGLQNGGYAIAYRDNGWSGNANTDISVAIYDANGVQQKIIEANVGHAAGDQVTPSITALSNGFIAVGWTNAGAQASSDFAVFDQNGNLLLNNATPYVQGADNTLLSGGPGGALEFVNHDVATSTADVYYDTFERHITGNGSGETITGDSLPDIVNALGGNDTVYGGGGDDYIDGGDGIDHLYGGDGVDILHGGANDDLLDGGTGQDAMYGGTGNDTYYVDSVLDQVFEAPNEGTDTVYASVSFALSDNVENLVLQPGAANGTGNVLDNVIAGNDSDNVLKGMDGNDTIKGGGGNDTIDGGAGDDTAIYSGTRFDYHVSQLANGDLQIADLRPGSPDGSDTVHAVEHFAFADGTVTAAALVTPASVHWTASVDAGAHPGGYQPAAIGDFNADGTSDVLWFNPANNAVDLWQISNGQWAGSSDLGSHPAGYQVAGSGDFNHDGTSDVLWFNSATNDAEVWTIQNGQWAGSTDIGSHPAGYQIAGVGDFNHDGTSDVLWYNAATNDAEVWTIQNGHWAASSDIGQHPAGFQIAGVGDFNHDGTSDVLWFNQATGETDLWMINNGHWAASSNLGVHPAGYQPAAVGDFAHDGNADILWYNPTSGDTDVWKMFDGHWAGSDSLGAHPAGWQPAGAGDFNHDGVTDVAWFNPSSGHVEEWLLGNS